MKKNKLFSLLLLCNIILCSCGDNSKHISIFIYTYDDTFISSLVSNLRTLINESNIDANYYYASRSQAKQNEQITNEIENNNNKLLVVNSVDRLADSSIIDKAKLYDLPVIFFNREPLDKDLEEGSKYYYVGSNPKSEGLLQAKMAKNLFGSPYSLNSLYDKNGDGKIQTVLLKGEQGHQDMENRSKYCIQGLENSGYKVDLLTTSYCNWSRSLGAEEMEKIYDSYGDQIELIFSNNDDMALGAIDYLLEKNIFSSTATDVSEQPIQIIGVDATSVARTAISNHLMYGTVKNDAKKQAETISELTNLIIENKSLDGVDFTSGNKIYVPGQEITIADIND
ncbi:MAG: galactose ABC transporter substrate-binding protein [Bacilli bacterium]